MTDTDHIELHALYGFKKPSTVDLDAADFEWLEVNADVVAYTRTRDALPVGFWLSEGFAVEVVDTRYVGADDIRALQTLKNATATSKGVATFTRNELLEHVIGF